MSTLDLDKKQYVRLNRLALQAKIKGLAAEGRALRAPLQRVRPHPDCPDIPKPRRRPARGGNRVWLRVHASMVGEEARWHQLAYAYLYRKGFAHAESAERTRTLIAMDRVVAIAMHYHHLDEPKFPYDGPGTHAERRASHEAAKAAYKEALASFERDLRAAIEVTNRRYTGNRQAWEREEPKRADRRASRRESQVERHFRGAPAARVA